MADCNDLFQKFYDQIKLTPSKKDSLKTARRAIRDKIRKYFKDNLKQAAPKFHSQGSYAMSTIINPIDEEYDLDDGVYLQNIDSDKSKWPAAEIVHEWICDAVRDQTEKDPIDKRTCIRVVYSGKYHVDLPIYGMHNKNSYLAEKGKLDWSLSDPKAITDWFEGEVEKKGEQLRKIVRYLKAWADNKSKSGKLPCSLVLTVLAVNNYENSDRDDGSFTKTVTNIYNQILRSPTIVNPVDPYELLSDNVTETEMNNFRGKLSMLVDNASEALRKDSKQEACEVWRKEFGDRFPIPEEEEEEGKAVASSIIISDPPKPWSP